MIKLSSEQYEEIKRTVIDTFIEYDIRSIPISAFEMAIKMGIKVVPYSSMDKEQLDASLAYSLDGYSLETNSGEWIIYYNDFCKNYGRINQTIMHEIGHFAMGHTEDGDEEEKEAEAKFFAKYALAPPPLIHNMNSPVNAETVMMAFDISHQAAVIACRYYRKWLKYGGIEYTDYEMKMLHLFKIA